MRENGMDALDALLAFGFVIRKRENDTQAGDLLPNKSPLPVEKYALNCQNVDKAKDHMSVCLLVQEINQCKTNYYGKRLIEMGDSIYGKK